METWNNRVADIKNMLDNGMTLAAVGQHYGVSRQRMYQVLTQYGITTYNYKRKNFLRDKAPRVYWLNKMLARKVTDRNERMEMLKTVALPDLCPIFGVTLLYEGTGEIRKHSADSPSVDRIDSSKGYVKGNIHIISKRANTIKNDATAQELRAIADYLDSLIVDSC